MLTHKEFHLVRILAEQPGTAVSRQELMDRIWGDASASVSRGAGCAYGGSAFEARPPRTDRHHPGFGYRWTIDENGT
jgi:hypothetical protein